MHAFNHIIFVMIHQQLLENTVEEEMRYEGDYRLEHSMQPIICKGYGA